MKLLRRNLVPIWYCLLKSKTVNAVDDDGYETGEPVLTYENPVEMMCNVSPATGSAHLEMFGTFDAYDKVIVTDDLNCPIDENTMLYVDSAPTDSNTYDYRVYKVAKSINSISIAVSKVKIS